MTGSMTIILTWFLVMKDGLLSASKNVGTSENRVSRRVELLAIMWDWFIHD